MQSMTDAVLSVGAAGMRWTVEPHNGLLSRLAFSLPVWQAETRQHTMPLVLHFFFFSLDIIMSGL